MKKLHERTYTTRQPVKPLTKSLAKNLNTQWFKALTKWFTGSEETSMTGDVFFTDAEDTLWVKPRGDRKIFWWDEIAQKWITGRP
jgi:hypothetical protein